MARPVKPAGPAPSIEITPERMRSGVGRLTKRLEEVDAFNVQAMQERTPPELAALSAGILSSLAKTFGEDTAEYRRFAPAANLQWNPAFAISGGPIPLQEYKEATAKNFQRAHTLLAEAIKSLTEDLAEVDAQINAASATLATRSSAKSNKVFVVHGHDEGARETIARFLERLGFVPVILHEQANQGRTIIEKVEAHGDVGFAVVLLTVDDEGRIRGTTELRPRARQNVLLELGYFIGRLGRDRVCALKRGDVELPSDFAGVVWETMDAGTGWKQALGRELDAAGYSIDWNKVMGR